VFRVRIHPGKGGRVRALRARHRRPGVGAAGAISPSSSWWRTGTRLPRLRRLPGRAGRKPSSSRTKNTAGWGLLRSLRDRREGL